MRIAKERSNWLAGVAFKWLEVSEGLAPCVYDPSENITWMQMTLTLITPFRVSKEDAEPKDEDDLDTFTRMPKDSSFLPEYLRNALQPDIFGEIHLIGKNEKVRKILVNIEAKGKLKDINRFRDAVVRKLLQKTAIKDVEADYPGKDMEDEMFRKSM